MTAHNRIAVIPAYEPDETLISLLQELSNSGWSSVVVDDGSGPDYLSIFENAETYSHVISYAKNHGKGYALKKAFAYLEQKNCHDNTIVVLDCDGQHTVPDAIRLADLALAHPGTLILGSRRQSFSSPLRSRFGNAVTRLVFRAVSGVRIYDTQTGMRAFSSDMLPMLLRIPGDRYEYEMQMLLSFAEQHIPMKEVPIRTIYLNNNAGSHFRALRDSWMIYKEILKFSFASFASFLLDYGIYSLLFAVFGAPVLLANVAARVCSAIVNFFLNRKFVFKREGPLAKQAWHYFLLAAAILCANTGILWFLTQAVGIHALIAKLLTETLLFLCSYLVQKRWVFRRDTSLRKEHAWS